MKNIYSLILCVFIFNSCSNNNSIFIGQEWFLVQADYDDDYNFTGIKSELWFKNDSLYIDNNQKLVPLIHLNDSMMKCTYEWKDKIVTDTMIYRLIELREQQFLMLDRQSGFLLFNSSINNPNAKIYNCLDFKIDGFSIGDTVDKSLLKDIKRNEYLNHISEAKSISNNIEFEIVNDLIYSIKHLEIDPNDVDNLFKIINEKCGFLPDTIDYENSGHKTYGYKWKNQEYNIALEYSDLSGWYKSRMEFYKDDYFMKRFIEKQLREQEANKYWSLEYENYMLQKFIISNCDEKTYSINIE